MPSASAARTAAKAEAAKGAVARLAQRAAECEAAGEWGRADQLHREHVAANTTAEVSGWQLMQRQGCWCACHQEILPARDRAV